MALAVGVGAGVQLADREPLAVMEGLAPAVMEAVGEALTVELTDWLVEGEGAGVLLALPVGVGVGVGLGVPAGLALLLRELLALLLGEAPAVREAVGEALTVLLLE